MSEKSNMPWTVYKKLEKDVIDLSYYIHFSDKKLANKHNQIWTYSNQIADLLIAISTQIESLFLELYKNEFKSDPNTIGIAISEIEGKWNLSTKRVKIISKNMYFTDVNGFGSEFAPMAYKSHDENDYYSSYCAVKHNRIDTIHKANINVLIRALAALFILNAYYSFEKDVIDNVSEFDFSLDSDMFMADFSINSYSSNSILIVVEDEEYLKKISTFADAIPDFDSGEFLKYTDENSQPKRFIVKINKQEDSVKTR